MKKNLLFTLVLCGLVSLSSCSKGLVDNELGFKIVCPIGAPSLALASFATDSENCLISATPQTVIPGAFTEGKEFDAIIFDMTKGATFIEKKNANYKLVRTLTKGNAYIVSLGNDDNNKIDEDDYVVSFGGASIFNSLFTKMYGVTLDSNKNGVAAASLVAQTGLDEGNVANYVILSEPYVTSVLKANSKAKIFASLVDDFEDYSKKQGYNGGKGFKGFPQAGLFISAKLEQDEAKLKPFLETIDSYCNELENNNGKAVIERIKKDSSEGKYGDKKIAEVYGVNEEVLSSVLEGNKLAFNSGEYDVNKFFLEASLEGYNAFNESTFSTFYR